jgi:hypothetical protein
MKALSTLKSAFNQSTLYGIIALVMLTPVLFPGIAQAAELQTQGQQSQIFEIKITDPSLLISNPNNNQNTLTLDTVQKSDPLYTSLHSYLQAHNSPLQYYTAQLLTYSNWPMIVSISFVESDMCQHSLDYNCSGLGGQKYLRKYQNYGQWIQDMSNLLSQRYQGWTLSQMDGVYVQPVSYNWKIGSEEVLAQLTALQKNANQQRVQIAETSVAINQSNKDLATIAQ